MKVLLERKGSLLAFEYERKLLEVYLELGDDHDFFRNIFTTQRNDGKKYFYSEKF